jgi:hypothetical protein
MKLYCRIAEDIIREQERNGGELPDQWPIPTEIYAALKEELENEPIRIMGVPVIELGQIYTREIKRYPLAQIGWGSIMARRG